MPTYRLQCVHKLEGNMYILIARAAHRLQVNTFIPAYRGSLIYLMAFGCHFPLLLRHAFSRPGECAELIR